MVVTNLEQNSDYQIYWALGPAESVSWKQSLLSWEIIEIDMLRLLARNLLGTPWL